ncbi:hypothetical protein [Bradyrhizobium genomosp. III]|uniref:hypothetical protein n=1 Tax=Bradyrhizobium genomosp. III TaxID=2683271 RepID=UPI000576BCC9|nr:hypothetical protein [Bradyrhizobium sp. CCBAU 15544]
MENDPRLAELAGTNDRMSQIDRRFFERFPHRRHRIRIGHPAEVEAGRIAYSAERQQIPQGFCHYVVVKSFAPDIRLRASTLGPLGIDTDADEVTARSIFQRLLEENPKLAKIDAGFREMMQQQNTKGAGK